MKIKLGMGLHWLEDSTFTDLCAQIEEAESLGYEQIWVSNEKFFYDMYVVATIVAEHSNKMSIGTFVADPYTHHPALTAMSIATLDKVSNGRAILGIGAGGTGFPAMGIQRVKPAKAIKDAVKIIRPLWRGETVNYEGEVISFKNGRLNFKAHRNIPIAIATRGDYVLRVAGEIADIVMIATYAEPGGIEHALSQVTKGVRKSGRSMDDITIISRVDACISSDRQLAINAVKSFVGVFLWTSYPDRKFVHRVGLEVPQELEKIIAKRDYNLMAVNAHLIPDAFVDKFCWAGTAEEVAIKVAKVAQMGIDNITFLAHPPKGEDTNETVREFAETVKPMVEEIVNQ
jgi:5,10-methylenetetrahydromethanopterin reductase